MNPRYTRWGPAEWRGRVPTVGHLRREGWPVVATCQTCMLAMTVRLDQVIAAKGEAFSLWGRTAPCRRRHCAGRMVFFVEPPRAEGPVLMMD